MSIHRCRPYSRAVSWTAAPIVALILTLLFVPQVADILCPSWSVEALEKSIGIFANVVYYAFVLLLYFQWRISTDWLFLLDRLLACDNGEAIGHQAQGISRLARVKLHKLKYCPFGIVKYFAVQLFCNIISDTKEWRVRKTALYLAAAGFGSFSIAIPLFIIGIIPFEPRWMPLICFYLTVSVMIFIGTKLSIMHQGFNNASHKVALVTLMPLFLIYLGLFAVDATAVVLTWITFLVLAMLPFIMVQLRQGNQRANLLRSGWFWGSLFFSVLILVNWNWQDQITFPHEDERQNDPPRQHRVDQFKSIVLTNTAKPIELPPIFLNLGGGGSRAAVFIALVLSQLWWLKVDTNTLSASEREVLDAMPIRIRSVVIAGKTVFPGRIFLLGVRFTSSVSGGSLAAAYWNSGVLTNLSPETELDPPIERRIIALQSFFGSSGARSCYRDVAFGSPFNEDLTSHERTEQLSAIENDPFIYAMSRNYLAPAIVGLFSTTSSRRALISHAFEDYGISKLRLSDLFYDEANGILPYSMFNATLTTSGERFLLTNLSPSWFTELNLFGPSDEYLWPPIKSDSRFRARPGKVLTHLQADPAWDPKLSTAAWVSSDFPFGFPVNRIRVDNLGNKSDRVIGTLDGGLSDNLGINSSLSVVRTLAKQISVNFPQVFIFDIDTSESPFDPDSPAQLWYHYQEAYNAIIRAKQVAEQTTWALYLKELSQDLQLPSADVSYAAPVSLLTDPEGHVVPSDKAGDGLKTGIKYIAGFTSRRWRWFRIRSGELKSEHVSTSWHLPKEELRRLFEVSLREDIRAILLEAVRSYMDQIATLWDHGKKGPNVNANIGVAQMGVQSAVSSPKTP